MPVPDFTLIVPYYRAPLMLSEQVRTWNQYPCRVRVIVVDDGSPEPALPFIHAHATQELRNRLELYRIEVDIPWNRGGARNLGAHVATLDWLLHVDIDHVLPPVMAGHLVDRSLAPSRWYRFGRERIGRADETRRKDAIPTDASRGPVHPHIDSYLCPRDLYWQVGGYDEDYSGCLGGGSPFLRRLEAAAKPALLNDVVLQVFTRDAIADASVADLSRDKTEYTRRRKAKEKTGRTTPVNPLRFPWRRVL